jgi:hypothetical protein
MIWSSASPPGPAHVSSGYVMAPAGGVALKKTRRYNSLGLGSLFAIAFLIVVAGDLF